MYLRNGHILYSAPAAEAREDMNLWELALDETGAPSGTSRQLTQLDRLRNRNLDLAQRITHRFRSGESTNGYLCYTTARERDEADSSPPFLSTITTISRFSDNDGHQIPLLHLQRLTVPVRLLRQDVDDDQPQFVFANPTSIDIQFGIATPDGRSIPFMTISPTEPGIFASSPSPVAPLNPLA